MKRFFSLLLVAAMTLSGAVKGFCNNFNNEASLSERLKGLEDVVSVEKLESDIFAEKYVVKIKQPLDYNKPELGEFTQRFILSHVDENKPMVIVTEGYGAAYALNPKYRSEISTKLNTNEVVVEHRYFLESTPEPCNWKYMNGFNSANDLHRISTILKEIYSDKWISTGISKGGQTSIIYRTYFPDDVDLSVPYVAPVCFGVEDGRHEPFIAQCGTPTDRAKTLMFQREVLVRKAKLVPMLKELATEKKWDFKDLSLEEVIDYCVLEYPFSFWQWGYSSDEIPEISEASDKEIFDYLMKTSSADYFGTDPNEPFFVQAATDLGYYGYDTKPLQDLLTIESAQYYLYKLFLPKEAKKTKFNGSLNRDIYKYLGKNDPNMIFIYGQFDPWSAAAVDDKLFVGKKNMKKYVQDGGSHKARIATMPQNVQNEIWNKIEQVIK
ncbi:MAG: S28 family serine protease [Rikenellaceae bacterium]